MQAHIGVGADSDPLQDQEQHAEHQELGGHRRLRVDELRQEGGEDEDGFRIAVVKRQFVGQTVPSLPDN